MGEEICGGIKIPHLYYLTNLYLSYIIVYESEGRIMEELTLEKEFEFFKLQHMYDILFVRITNYYRDLQTTGVTLPEFMRKNPQYLAELEMQKILANSDKEQFYNLYEKAYQELALIDEI